MKSSHRVFGPKTNHVRHIHLQCDMNSNKMERLNGTFRYREVAFRGLKKDDTAMIPGFRVYYNYVKKHSGIGGKTPAEEVGIKVEGANKWKTLIQNAALNQIEAYAFCQISHFFNSEKIHAQA